MRGVSFGRLLVAAVFAVASLASPIVAKGAGTSHVVDRADYATDAAAGAALVSTVAGVAAEDRILVKPGTYKIAAPLLVSVTGVTLCGTSGTADDVIIDAGCSCAGVVVTAAGCSVSGLTVKNAAGYANGSTYCGGGLALLAEGSVASNCVVSGCVNGGVEKDLRGGGVYLYKSTLADSLVRDCILSNDMASTGKTPFYGGGVYALNSTVRNVEVAGCLAFNNQYYASNTWDSGRVTGGGLLLDASAATDCYVHDNVITNGPKQLTSCNVSFGAGVALLNSTLSRSLVKGNRSCYSYAGAYLQGNSSLTESTISSNAIYFAFTGAYPGAGVVLNDARQAMTDCLLEGNENRGTYWDAGGAAGQLSNGKFLGGVVRGNVAYNNHGGGFLVAGPVLVSNVVFDANWSTANGGTCRGTGAIEYRSTGGSPGGSTVRDCWFVRNVGGDNAYNGSGVVSFDGLAAESLVQNCFFAYNTGACVIGGSGSMKPTHAACRCESCTFVKNPTSRGPVWCGELDWSYPYTMSNMYFTGCVFYKNGPNEDKPGIPVKFGQHNVVNTTYTYDEVGTGLVSGDYHNLTAADGDPNYRDPANGNFALKPTSVLRQAGLYADWMGEGTKAGPQDMGDGTWDEKSAATITVRGTAYEVGAVVTRRNACRRVGRAGDAPEIGCSEFYKKSGFYFFVR